MPGGSKKGGGLEVGSAYKMKYNKSSFPFKTDPVDEAKKLVIENVGNTTVDSPSSDDTNFDESEKNIIKATTINIILLIKLLVFDLNGVINYIYILLIFIKTPCVFQTR